MSPDQDIKDASDDPVRTLRSTRQFVHGRRDDVELFKCRLELLDDRREHVRRGIGRVLKTVIFELKQVEVDFIAYHQGLNNYSAAVPPVEFEAVYDVNIIATVLIAITA